jgi:hypothetical protein
MSAKEASLHEAAGESLVPGIETPLRGDRFACPIRSEFRAGELSVAKRPLFILVALVCALVTTTPAQADSLLSGVLPGLVAPADTPDVCDTSASQAFARWGDTNLYVLAPGGAFEAGDAQWKLSGNARVVRGNEPFFVHDRSDTSSLYLPEGGSATSPPMCFAAGDWHFRLFSSGTGSVRVKVIVRSLLGVVSTLDGGTVKSGSSWRPSSEVDLLLSNLCSVLATDSISVRLTATNDSSVRVDDVYLDPWKVG